MSLNGLTGSAGLKLGPLVLETLVKHYFERLKASQKIPATTSSDGVSHEGGRGGSTLNNNLRQEELLYDQAFTIVKVSIARVPRRPHHRTQFAWLACPRSWLCSVFTVADPHDSISPSPRAALRTSCLPLLGK